MFLDLHFGEKVRTNHTQHKTIQKLVKGVHLLLCSVKTDEKDAGVDDHLIPEFGVEKL